MRELALFAGAGGGILGGLLLGWRTVCAVEIDAYCRNVLLARQQDGFLPIFPIWDDVRTFDGRMWRGHVDVITGGFPCQDISAAGTRLGLTGERSGLVFEMLRIIKEVRPRFVFAENSPYLRTRGLGTIIKELAIVGYDCRWCVLGGWHVGAPHKRNRMWLFAYPNSSIVWEQSRWRGWKVRKETQKFGGSSKRRYMFANSNVQRLEKWQGQRRNTCKESQAVKRSDGKKISQSKWWRNYSFQGMDDGVADWMDRIKATGNGQIPAVATLAWNVLTCDLVTGG